MSRYKEINLSRLKTLSMEVRESKVDQLQMAAVLRSESSFKDFFHSLPRTLAAKQLHGLVDALVSAQHHEKSILLMMGAHVIKVGLSPIIIDWMRHGKVQCLSVNGACAIHDMELAFFGRTSEDVGALLKNGRFGMSEETASLVNEAIVQGAAQGLGFGEAIGKRILDLNAPNSEVSLFAQAYALGIPVTVHVGMGTDIVHQHPNADGAAIGETSLRDFRIFSGLIPGLHQGGVVLLFGSSVILPEVFLKALTVARNIHGPVDHFTTANFDMIQHYRPTVNVLQRPTQDSGQFFQITGHHEIMMPLLAAAWACTEEAV